MCVTRPRPPCLVILSVPGPRVTLLCGFGIFSADERHNSTKQLSTMPKQGFPHRINPFRRMLLPLQVTRFLAAASSSFESLPLSDVNLSVVLEVFSLPQLMLDAPEMTRVITKARAKLLDLYGDLEKVRSLVRRCLHCVARGTFVFLVEFDDWCMTCTLYVSSCLQICGYFEIILQQHVPYFVTQASMIHITPLV